MFDRGSLPSFRLLPARPQASRGGYAGRALVLAGLAVALAASALVISPGVAAAVGPQTGEPSIQYREAVAHASQKYDFTPGGVVTVPFRPRVGDTTAVDGAAPVALPAARGSGVATPGTATPAVAVPSSQTLRREVFGFLPYWELGSTLDYTTISTIAYFGVDLRLDSSINTSSSGWGGWASASMTSIIQGAHAAGTRIALTVESFAWDSAGRAAQTTLLSSPTLSLAAAQNIAAEVGRRGVDGVNLDFEPIAPGQVTNFVTFTRMLRAQLDLVHPGYELTFCATGAPGTYDLPNLLADGAADAVFIMGYDLRGGTPGTTGSIDPLTSPVNHNTYTLTSITNTFMSQVPVSKIILGLPWYGHAWSTGSTNAQNAPPGNIPAFGPPATGIIYSTAKGIADMNPAFITCPPVPQPSCIGWQYDSVEQSAWTAYFGNYGGSQDTWRELYFDNAQSLGAKIDAINGWNLRGVGIWALGYDNNNGNGDLTAEVALKLSGVPSTYVPMAPTRILDTRLAIGGPAWRVVSHVARPFQVAAGTSVPAGATAVTGNLTVTGQTSPGYLYLGPDPLNTPGTSTLNFPVGDDRANAVTVALNATGVLNVTYVGVAAGATADVIFDVTGYFIPDQSGALYTPVSPTRILDTRFGTGGAAAVLTPHVARPFQVTGGSSGVPSTATAVTGNLTVTQQTGLGYVYLGPVAANNPTSSSLNFPKGDDRANAVTVQLGAGGTLAATYVSAAPGATTQLIFDVTGYFAPGPGGSSYVPLTPTRILDTRFNTGLSSIFPAGWARTFSISGNGRIPAAATGVTGNLTVTGQTSLGFLYIGPTATNNPTSSTLNFPTGDDRANSVTVQVGAGGFLSCTYIAPGPGPYTNVIFDVTGYFTQ